MAAVRVLEKKWVEQFAKNLARTMDEAGISQAELSRLSGLSTGTISRYLTGERSPKAYHVHKIASALKTTSDDLLSLYQQF